MRIEEFPEGIEDEELEQVWAGKKSAKDALDSIVSRGNAGMVMRNVSGLANNS